MLVLMHHLVQSPFGYTLRMIRDNNITAAEVEKVDIAGNRSNVSTLFYHHPTTGLEAKFSMEFAVSILLLDGKAGLGHFTDAVVKREDVQNMLRRTNLNFVAWLRSHTFWDAANRIARKKPPTVSMAQW